MDDKSAELLKLKRMPSSTAEMEKLAELATGLTGTEVRLLIAFAEFLAGLPGAGHSPGPG
ncbi:hypothetical protein ES703_81649 [subsurface metagenome]